LPQTEALAGSILSLPMYPELSLASVDRVCEELTRILG
jgi:dTDP-4-amino-4,6-dideoxygalactose transaminase